MGKLKTIYMATPDIGVSVLKELARNSSIELVDIITMPDRPAGRGKRLQPPEIKTAAQKLNLSIKQSENINKDDDLFKYCQQKNIDLIIVFAFAQFLGEKWLSLPRLGCFNIHTSLLPKYRGAAPIHYAIWNGDKTTGISIQKMVKKMDAGAIALSQEVSIENEETTGELYEKLKHASVPCLKKFIQGLVDNTLTFETQDEQKATFAPSIDKKQGLLLFESESSQEVLRKIRAFTPFPGCYFFLNNLRVKVFKAHLSEARLSPGHVQTNYGQLLIGCKKGSIHLSEVQLEGKKRSSDIELLNGLKNKISTFIVSPPL